VWLLRLVLFALIPHTKNKEWPITLKKIFPAIIREKIPCQKFPLYPEIFFPKRGRELSLYSKGIHPYVWMIGNFPVLCLSCLISGIKITKIEH
jgi:hypothetical protein